MNLQTIINTRFSCRAYTSEAVSEEDLEYIKQCVSLAPSAVNKQPWHFYLVRSEEGKARLRRCYDREWFATAPLYVLATVLHDEEWVRADGKQHGNIDVSIATEHLCLAATERGLGTCWVCNFDAALAHQLFALPATEEAAVIIPIGHPACPPSAKKRKPLEAVFSEV